MNYSYSMLGSLSMGEGTPEVQESGILRPFLIGVFTVVALLLHAYAIMNNFHQISALFPHLYYIPIVLASIWYPRRGLLFICVLVGVSIGMIFFGFANGIPFDPLILVYMAIYIWVVATTSVFTMEQWKNLSRFLLSKKRDPQGQAGGIGGGGGLLDISPIGSGEDLDSLLSTLSIEDTRVRKAAISSLGKSRDERAVGPLITLMGDENRTIREASAQALGSLGRLAVRPLIRSLKDSDWHIRMGSAIALRIIGDPEGVEPLIGALSDENRFVRRESVKSLGRIGDSRVTDPLIAALQDRDIGVRVRAAASLGKIADPRALSSLTDALSDRNGELHDAAVEAISKIKNSRTLAE